MKIFIFCFSLLFVNAIFAQSYLYNRGASGPAFSYTRIKGVNAFAVDFTYLGRLSVGGSLVSDNNTQIYGLNGTLNIYKFQNAKGVFSIPVFVGYQNYNGSALTFGVGAYTKLFSTDDFCTALGASFASTSYKNANSRDNNTQFGIEVFVFYKSLKVGPSFLILDSRLSIGFAAGMAFGHNFK